MPKMKAKPAPKKAPPPGPILAHELAIKSLFGLKINDCPEASAVLTGLLIRMSEHDRNALRSVLSTFKDQEVL